MVERPIVLPLDGSKNAENAMPIAAQLSSLYEAPVVLVHSLESHLSEGDVAPAREAFRAYAKETAQRHGLAKHGCTVEFGVGPAAPIILAAAEDARFVVIASHGRGGFKATVVGSVADRVVRGAKVPLVFVPAVGPAPTLSAAKPVLVALDGDPHAESGLAAGRELAARLGARIALVRAYAIPPTLAVEGAYIPAGEVITAIQEGAEEYVAKTAFPVERTFVSPGNASDVITAVANEIDANLVVVTSRSKSRLERLTLGSTTERLMHTMRRPMLIVPPQPA